MNCRMWVSKGHIPGEAIECPCGNKYREASVLLDVATVKAMDAEAKAIQAKADAEAEAEDAFPHAWGERNCTSHGVCANVYKLFRGSVLPAYKMNKDDWDDHVLGKTWEDCMTAFSSHYSSGLTNQQKAGLCDEFRKDRPEDMIGALVACFNNNGINAY